MTETTESKGELKSTGYELFILLLSLVSIINLVVGADLYFFPTDPLTLGVLAIIDTILTIFFLFDFAYRITTAPSKSHYFFRNWGWADLLACVPFLRIFRVFRILRAYRLMRSFGLSNMVNEIVNNRAGSALYITMFALIVLVETAAVFVLKFESVNPDANLTSAGDAVWWVFVTVTTVGYGDRFPTTLGGRALGVLVMFGGIALIGVLASFLSNFFLAPPKEKSTEAPAGSVAASLGALRIMLKEQAKLTDEVEARLAEIERSVGEKKMKAATRRPGRRKAGRRS
jgi:voltage-gated potassium channel